MKKVGIITINDNDNYGNRLQNYAVQEFLKEIEVAPKTIRNYRWTNANNFRTLRFIKNIRNLKFYSKSKNRKNNFREFNKLIQWDKKYYSVNRKFEEYDCLLVGSDQVWNPYFGISHATLLEQVNIPKIAFSASFGVNKLDENQKKMISPAIKKFSAISVREKSAISIINDITSNSPLLLVDPTLLIDSKAWSNISRKPKITLNKPYIFTYFLSGPSLFQEEIKKYKEQYGYEVYTCLDINNSQMYDIGPMEFIYMIEHAEFVLTDSFHASVFSFIFDKPFRTYDRRDSIQNMFSRIVDFFELFHLEDNNGENTNNSNVLKCDYSLGKSILIDEKKKAQEFIYKALDSNY